MTTIAREGSDAVGFESTQVDESSRFMLPLLISQTEETFNDYSGWRQANPDLVAAHLESYQRQAYDLTRGQGIRSRIASIAMRSKVKTRAEHTSLTDEIAYFGVINLGEIPGDQDADDLAQKTRYLKSVFDIGDRRDHDVSQRGLVSEQLTVAFPEIGGSQEIAWLSDRLENLYRILPDFVIKAGGMGKVAKTLLGVTAIAAADSMSLSVEDRRRRILDSIRPAYYFAITYPIVDDVFQDSDYISDPADRDKYHTAISRGLATGEDIDTKKLPDHPLVDEMLLAYDGLRAAFPFGCNREIYDALESMYKSQHSDSISSIEEIRGLQDIYPQKTLKVALARVIANQLAGRSLDDDRTDRLLKTLFRNQLVDDFRDYRQDLDSGLLTPFTLRILDGDTPIGNPLCHLFAYEAFVANRVYPRDTETVSRVLAKFGMIELAKLVGGDKVVAAEVKDHFGDHAIDRLIDSLASLGKRTFASDHWSRTDKQIEEYFSANSLDRDPQTVEPRTYLSDSIKYVEQLLDAEFENGQPVFEVIKYALEAGGKRVRPVITLMLAESLGVPRSAIEPLLISVEVAHTASLIFDDLPAQDNASLRRGKPTAHIKFNEYDAQLAGIAMISHSLGILGRLQRDFPADKVNEVLEYMGTVLGAEKLCLGQHMDLSMNRGTTIEEIIDMYSLKTSSMIEGALVPLMILKGRPPAEINSIKEFAHYAGLVFQIRDDILDATSDAEIIGKDTGQDVDKQNFVTLLGIDVATAMVDDFHARALLAIQQINLPTSLLQNLVTYFSQRKK